MLWAFQGVGACLIALGVSGALQRASAEPLPARPSTANANALRFERNHGQFAEPVRFLARSNGFTLSLTQQGATLTLPNGSQSSEQVRVRVVGGVATEPVGQAPLAGRSNYFVGQDRTAWRANVESFARVLYRGVLPGVDVAYYGSAGRELEYDLLLAAGTDPRTVALTFDGAESITLSDSGEAVLHLPSGAQLVKKAPVAYQTDAQGRRALVPVRYELRGQQLGFAVGAYDTAMPLTIDPVLSYSSLIGAQNFDQLNAVATDSAGNTYLAGYTTSGLFPTTSPLQPTYKGGTSDAVICKLTASGNAYTYCTYFGGSSTDQAYAVAADGAGNTYVTGVTYSTNFPTQNPFQAALSGGGTAADAFVLKLNVNGSVLFYSTYFGGTGDEFPSSIAVSAAGNARIAGQTFSTNLPTQAPLQATFGGDNDGFFTSLGAAGSTLEFSTYLGGNRADYATGITIAPNGEQWLTGWTKSANFITLGAAQATYAGNTDAFLTRINAGGSAVLSSTYLGGTGTDMASGVALLAGSPVVTGTTVSADFPVVAPAQATLASPGVNDGFVTRYVPNASSVVFSSYWGGAGDDTPAGIAADSENVYVVGKTSSANFPLIDPIKTTLSTGDTDAFLAAFTPSGISAYSAFFGGSSQDFASGVALRAGRELHIVGGTQSSNFPLVSAPSGFDTFRGAQDGFVVRSPALINRIAASASNWGSLITLGGVLLALGVVLQRRRVVA